MCAVVVVSCGMMTCICCWPSFPSDTHHLVVVVVTFYIYLWHLFLFHWWRYLMTWRPQYLMMTHIRYFVIVGGGGRMLTPFPPLLFAPKHWGGGWGREAVGGDVVVVGVLHTRYWCILFGILQWPPLFMPTVVIPHYLPPHCVVSHYPVVMVVLLLHSFPAYVADTFPAPSPGRYIYICCCYPHTLLCGVVVVGIDLFIVGDIGVVISYPLCPVVPIPILTLLPLLLLVLTPCGGVVDIVDPSVRCWCCCCCAVDVTTFYSPLLMNRRGVWYSPPCCWYLFPQRSPFQTLLFVCCWWYTLTFNSHIRWLVVVVVLVVICDYPFVLTPTPGERDTHLHAFPVCYYIVIVGFAGWCATGGRRANFYISPFPRRRSLTVALLCVADRSDVVLLGVLYHVDGGGYVRLRYPFAPTTFIVAHIHTHILPHILNHHTTHVPRWLYVDSPSPRCSVLPFGELLTCYVVCYAVWYVNVVVTLHIPHPPRYVTRVVCYGAFYRFPRLFWLLIRLFTFPITPLIPHVVTTTFYRPVWLHVTTHDTFCSVGATIDIPLVVVVVCTLLIWVPFILVRGGWCCCSSTPYIVTPLHIFPSSPYLPHSSTFFICSLVVVGHLRWCVGDLFRAGTLLPAIVDFAFIRRRWPEYSPWRDSDIIYCCCCTIYWPLPSSDWYWCGIIVVCNSPLPHITLCHSPICAFLTPVVCCCCCCAVVMMMVTFCCYLPLLPLLFCDGDILLWLLLLMMISSDVMMWWYSLRWW